MEKIDKEIGKLAVFNQKEDDLVDLDPSLHQSKFSGITSIKQLKGLLRNYEGLVEG